LTFNSTGALSILDTAQNGSAGTLFGGNGISITAQAGDLMAKQSSISGSITGSGNNITITSGGGLAIGTLTGSNGNMYISAGSGQLNILSNASVSTTQGDLTLFNGDAVHGTINFGQNAQVTVNVTSGTV